MAPDHNPKALEMTDRLFPTVGRKRLQMVQEVVFQASVYAGMPATLVALQEIRKIYAELDGKA
jgi:hypothetical protein